MQPPNKERKYLVFRYDDFHSYSDSRPEKMLREVFLGIKAKFVMGVIPFVCKADWKTKEFQELLTLTAEKTEFLRKVVSEGVCEVALHGFSHQNLYRRSMLSKILMKKRNFRGGEFFGMSYKEQLEKIMLGKNYLASILDICPVSFIPPWNSYDENTIKALEYLGFKVLSAGTNIPGRHESPINFFNTNCSFDDFRSHVASPGLGKLRNAGKIIVIGLHAFDFKEINDKRAVTDFGEFRKVVGLAKENQDIEITDFTGLLSAVKL